MILQLKAIDFKDTIYTELENCAISKACKREFTFLGILNENKVQKGIYKIKEQYTEDKFNLDMQLAKSLEFNNNLIRNIHLIKI